jgi:hypothetical protein
VSVPAILIKEIFTDKENCTYSLNLPSHFGEKEYYRMSKENGIG